MSKSKRIGDILVVIDRHISIVHTTWHMRIRWTSSISKKCHQIELQLQNESQTKIENDVEWKISFKVVKGNDKLRSHLTAKLCWCTSMCMLRLLWAVSVLMVFSSFSTSFPFVTISTSNCFRRCLVFLSSNDHCNCIRALCACPRQTIICWVKKEFILTIDQLITICLLQLAKWLFAWGYKRVKKTKLQFEKFSIVFFSFFVRSNWKIIFSLFNHRCTHPNEIRT